MLIIDKHHNGPPNSGHGGVSSGRLAELVNPRRARVRLNAPIPLGEPMTGVAGVDGKTRAFAGMQRVATISRIEDQLAVNPFDLIAPDVVTKAEAGWLTPHQGQHPFPTCFGCGTDRINDGLGLTPGLVEDRGIFATNWTPNFEGQVPAWFVWAALDCPTGGPALAAAKTGEGVVTGELAVEIRGSVVGGEKYQILSREKQTKGQMMVTEAALVDHDGQNLAVAQAIWFTVPLVSGVNQRRDKPRAA